MQNEPEIIQKWVFSLKRWGYDRLTASFLESAGSMTILIAQLIYFTQPLLNTFFSEEHLTVLANLLEEPARVKSFASLLRGLSHES
jgi:hypothetical protein